DQVEERKPASAKIARQRDHEAQIRLDHQLPRGGVAPLDPLCQRHLLCRGQQPVARRLREEDAERVEIAGRASLVVSVLCAQDDWETLLSSLVQSERPSVVERPKARARRYEASSYRLCDSHLRQSSAAESHRTCDENSHRQTRPWHSMRDASKTLTERSGYEPSLHHQSGRPAGRRLRRR